MKTCLLVQIKTQFVKCLISRGFPMDDREKIRVPKWQGGQFSVEQSQSDSLSLLALQGGHTRRVLQEGRLGANCVSENQTKGPVGRARERRKKISLTQHIKHTQLVPASLVIFISDMFICFRTPKSVLFYFLDLAIKKDSCLKINLGV